MTNDEFRAWLVRHRLTQAGFAELLVKLGDTRAPSTLRVAINGSMAGHPSRQVTGIIPVIRNLIDRLPRQEWPELPEFLGRLGDTATPLGPIPIVCDLLDRLPRDQWPRLTSRPAPTEESSRQARTGATRRYRRKTRQRAAEQEATCTNTHADHEQ